MGKCKRLEITEKFGFGWLNPEKVGRYLPTFFSKKSLMNNNIIEKFFISIKRGDVVYFFHNEILYSKFIFFDFNDKVSPKMFCLFHITAKYIGDFDFFKVLSCQRIIIVRPGEEQIVLEDK